MKKITIFTGLSAIGENIVGTAIIYVKIAQLLSAENFMVEMVVPNEDYPQNKKISYHRYDFEKNKGLIDNSDIIIFGAYPPIEDLQYAKRKKKKIISYLWTLPPIHSFEFKDFKNKRKQENLHQYIIDSYNKNLLLSDKIFCRCEKHRDFILGSLISLHRAKLNDYKDDPKLCNLLEIAPFGIDVAQKPRHKKNVYRGIMPGIDKDDFILLWNGGVWNWDNGSLMIEVMEKLKASKDIKLIFQGFEHPYKKQKRAEEAEKTYILAQKHNLANKNVFFNNTWIPYEERANYLLEANASITLRKNILESEYLIKTRYWDNFWSNLPMLINNFDISSDIIQNNGLGVVLKKEDPSYIAKEINDLKNNKQKYLKIRENLKKHRNVALDWQNCLQPLINYCKM